MLANKKILLTLLSIIIYVSVFKFYLYELFISWHNAKLIYNYLTLTMLIFQHYNKTDEADISTSLNDVLFWSIISNYVLVILLTHGIITELFMFHLFNGSILAVTLMILYCFFKHGYFSKKYNG